MGPETPGAGDRGVRVLLLQMINHAIDVLAEVPPPPGREVPESNDNVDIPSGLKTGISNIFGFITWVVFSLAAGGVLICAVRVAIAYKDGGQVLTPGLLSPLIACIVAVTATGIVGIVV